MMTRIELQAMLEELIGSKNVYFQPPESLKINYPCIIYSLSNVVTKRADNDIHKQNLSYELIIVDSNPDSEIFHKMRKLTRCRFKNVYVSENLNHFVFEIYNY